MCNQYFKRDMNSDKQQGETPIIDDLNVAS